MKQYLELLQTIKDKGTVKPPAREGMPGSTSLFGYQFRHNLADGFPLLTTKKINFKHIVTELLWFLKGDTNIKYLVDNGCNIWNEDAYNYYSKLWDKNKSSAEYHKWSFDDFVKVVKNTDNINLKHDWISEYQVGDCGYQYGKVWRKWDAFNDETTIKDVPDIIIWKIDQIKNLIDSLKNTPESRRHILTSIDPAHDNDLALYWCHALTQFNCRPRSLEEIETSFFSDSVASEPLSWKDVERLQIPKYYLDCQMYQRSADVFLGVPYNIASYALLTHILSKICNMVPGDMIYSYGDVHIYDNHKDQVNEQLLRIPSELPTLDIKLHMKNFDVEQFNSWVQDDFELIDYKPQTSIKAKLSTGLK